MPDTTFIYGTGLINEVRHTKEPEQVEDFRRACAITDKIWDYLFTIIRPGISEYEIEEAVAQKTREYGAEGMTFSPIVVSGERSSQPGGQQAAIEKIRPGMMGKGAMIFTVEPGIYIPGFGGVRIEDTVLLTAHGCESFYRSGKQLAEL